MQQTFDPLKSGLTAAVTYANNDRDLVHYTLMLHHQLDEVEVAKVIKVIEKVLLDALKGFKV